MGPGAIVLLTSLAWLLLWRLVGVQMRFKGYHKGYYNGWYDRKNDVDYNPKYRKD